jgi:hypothetical protein
MSADMFFYASLQFGDERAVKAAWQELEREGYQGHEDNLIAADLVRDGLEVSCRWDGSGPSSCFEITAGVLEVLARHASSGQAVALELEALWGYRYPGGYDVDDEDFDDELEEEEVEDLHRQLTQEP